MSTMKAKDIMMQIFVVTGGTEGCHYDIVQCDQRYQTWHYNDFRFSVQEFAQHHEQVKQLGKNIYNIERDVIYNAMLLFFGGVLSH